MIPAICLTARDHYLAKGIAPIPAAGIVAVLYCESALNPGSQGAQAGERGGVLNPAGAYGLASWNGPRQAALQSYAASKGLAVGLLMTQLDFVLTESANSYPTVWAAIQNPPSISDFVSIFVRDYEVPADPAAEIAKALPIAEELFAIAPAPTPAPTPEPPLPQPPVPIPRPPLPPLDPILTALLAQIIEALAAGVIKAVISQLGTQLVPQPSPQHPTSTGFDVQSLVGALAPMLTAQLTQSLPGLVAAEVAKLLPIGGKS